MHITKKVAAFAFAALLCIIPLMSGCASNEAVSVASNAVEIIEVASVETPFPVFESVTQTALPSNAAFPVNEPTSEANEIVVATVDELLAAIGSDRTIYLNPGRYDLTGAKDYGKTPASDFYEWIEVYDGYGLTVCGVQNVSILGHSAKDVEIVTAPRYANVLTFRNCENVSVIGATLGHMEAPGECAGGVLRLEQTDDVAVQDCKLFGCGILGVDAMECSDITVTGTEIYDCSQGALSFYCCRDVKLTDCNIHDCGEPTFSVNGCDNVTSDGKAIEETVY